MLCSNSVSCMILRWQISFGRVNARCISVASNVGVEVALLILMMVADRPFLVPNVRIL